MSYVDIAIIAIIAFFALWGLWKGVGKTVIKLICFAGALVVAYFLVDYVIDWLLGWELTRGFIIGDSGFSLRTLYYEAIGGEGFKASTGVMQHYVQPMIARYSSLGIDLYYGSVSLGEFVSLCMVFNTLNIVVIFLVYLVIRAVFAFIGWLLNKIFVKEEKNALSRLLGFVFGAVRGLALVAVILLLSSAVFPFGWAAGYTETVSNSILGNTAAQYTYLGSDWVVFNGDKTEELMSIAGYSKLTLEEKQEASTLALDEYKTYLLSEGEYSEDNLAVIDGIIAEGKTAIAAAEDHKAVAEAEAAAKADMDAVYTVAEQEQLANEITAAKAKLLDKFTELNETADADMQTALTELLTAGNTAISEVTELGKADGVADEYIAQMTALF